ncbi:hypothetical protein OG930_32530 [Streptomyces sp. NBC_01799]|uniref:hypothetical protein n=1 Tax=Streptomyces sp. NBC_01800 TaxID=2975945 RepID=UPI002DD9B08B|nr:hypothetical protein [Streptomyces sp. NBC_01800]WSA71431.1 hypothetical protein OIE65_33150 [Streptomyces sp. NBC_01800]WSA79942.1 hypothetical protein OG930_32530 [Streptomyces sp. NBC_01799]
MRRGRVLGALLPFVLLATGCGIRSTDVVEVGDSATVQVAPGARAGTVLYFISPSSRGGLLPVVRQVDSPVDTTSAGTGEGSQSWGKELSMLFSGPSPAEKRAGLRTELPMIRGEMIVRMDRQGVRVRLESTVNQLSELARQQLICTIAHARGAEQGTKVTVSGTDGSIGPVRCSV